MNEKPDIEPNWVIPPWALMTYTIFIAGVTVLLAVFT